MAEVAFAINKGTSLQARPQVIVENEVAAYSLCPKKNVILGILVQIIKEVK
jgi:hypothetical protein